MPLSVITLEEMRQWEKATWATGQTEAEVIRRVGLAVARCALDLTHPSELIVILAGKGHNGDDARCARDHLTNRRVDVLEVTDPETDLPKLDALLSLKPALVIDGLFGIGLNRTLSSGWVKFIDRVNERNLKVLAVDVPSGLDVGTGKPQGTAIRATVTLTVGAVKIGLLASSAWQYVGKLEVAHDVGLVAAALPETEVQWVIAEDFAEFPPARSVEGHKGTYGHLSILSGSLGYHGAAVLAARGAQRARPGLITLYTLESVYAVIASQLQAVMVSPWRADSDPAQKRSAILIGPGLASSEVPESIKRLVADLWRGFPGPLIVDASALGWVPSDRSKPAGLRVITPHPAEAARMLGCETKDIQSSRPESLRTLSQRFGGTFVVLKGHQTLIGRGQGKLFVNSSGNAYLAQGGSGDVLSGFVAGLLAQPALQSDPCLTLRYAVWEHGSAAERLSRRQRNWIVEELIPALGSERHGIEAQSIASMH